LGDGSGGPFAASGSTAATGGGQGHTHTITSDSHVPPYYEVAFIMKS